MKPRTLSSLTTRFQSTLPVRGATILLNMILLLMTNFNPRSPCGERLLQHFNWITTHCNFNPRSPCGERLRKFFVYCKFFLYFNPRSPCGERPG